MRTDARNEALALHCLELGAGQESELLNVFRTLTKEHPEEPMHLRNFARAYLKVGKPLLAVVQYQKYLVVQPNPIAYRELAQIYLQLNRGKNAEEMIKKAEALE